LFVQKSTSLLLALIVKLWARLQAQSTLKTCKWKEMEGKSIQLDAILSTTIRWSASGISPNTRQRLTRADGVFVPARRRRCSRHDYARPLAHFHFVILFFNRSSRENANPPLIR